MYVKEVIDNNITYSIDMLRLKTYLNYTTFTEIEFRFKTCWSKYLKKYYTTPHQAQFFYNYVIEVGEGQSFWFGFCHNNERRSFYDSAEYNFTIEFNPNKIKDNEILKYLLSLSSKWFIKSFDLAMDLKINILDIIVDIGLKRKKLVIDNGFDNKTIVMGKGDGRTKIYNKKLESDLKIQGDLTRVEVSRELDDFPINEIRSFKFGDFFPNLYLNKYLYSFDTYEDKTLFALLYAVQNNFPINELTRTYRKKIKDLLEGGYKIRFNPTSAYQALSGVIFYYFIHHEGIKWK